MKKILVVDDDEDIIALVSFILKQAGYIVLEAMDMTPAMNIIYRETPDLIILDLTLPQGNGFEICRLLKCDEKYKNIPIVILTAKTDKEDKFVSKIMDVQEYITKPFDSNYFIVRIINILERDAVKKSNY